MATLQEATAQVQELGSYVTALAYELQEGPGGEADEGSDFNDDGWESWLISWELWRASIVNSTQAIFETRYTSDEGWQGALQTWRDGANGWWAAARKAGRVRRPKDAGSDPQDYGDDTTPGTTTPGKTPPKGSPPIGKKPPAKDETKDSKTEPDRNKPWTALAIILAPLGLWLLAKGRK
jgi:hypothetical protein